jgi:Na+/H+-translocating membrane pyrophosphatase
MDYFDHITSTNFKAAPDGRKLFFPYGEFGPGYIIDSEQAYERLRRRFAIVWIICFLAVITIGIIIQDVLGIYFALLFLGMTWAVAFTVYMVWTRFLVRGLQPSNEKLSLGETWIQALAFSLGGLWFLASVALALVGASVVFLILDPRNWLMATASIVICGILAGAFAWMLVRQRRRGASADDRR